jgi:excisionase family DNA binding protein
MSARPVTLEDTIETAVTRAVSQQVTRAVEELRAEIVALRRALPPQFGSVADAAKVLGCCNRTVWRQIRAGKLPSRKVGRKTVVDLVALHAVTVTDDDTDSE